ncbi:MAG: AlpA family phage regulatory protein [Rhizorhabdus sp.]
MNRQNDSILSLLEVKAQTNLSRPTIYRRMERSDFPARVRLGPGRVGWWQSEISDWLQSRPRA